MVHALVIVCHSTLLNMIFGQDTLESSMDLTSRKSRFRIVVHAYSDELDRPDQEVQGAWSTMQYSAGSQ